MKRIIDLSYKGVYGYVRSELYRTKKTFNWYRVSESSWSGNGSISTARVVDPEEAVSIIMLYCPSDIQDYPELEGFVAAAIDE